MNVEKDFGKFCEGKKCPEFVVWSFGEGSRCESCKLVGQSYTVDSYPSSCLFLQEIKQFEQEQLDDNVKLF
jgi:hypothetical protein